MKRSIQISSYLKPYYSTASCLSQLFRVYVFKFYSELIIRIIVCFAACIQWTPHENTNVLEGVYNVASTLEDCQAACVNNFGCNGIDYVAGNRPQSRCWLSGTWSGRRNNGTAPGVTHYDYDRTCGTEPQRNICIVSFLQVGPAVPHRPCVLRYR